MLLYSPFHSAIAATVCLAFTAASPLYDTHRYPNIEPRQVVNCTDPRAVTFTECWDQLDVETYLKSWVVKTPQCSSTHEDGVDCCTANEPWSTCFLRLASGYAGEDCTTLSPQLCTFSRLNPSLDSSIVPKVRYVVTAIQAIHDVFKTYSSALATAQPMVDLSPVLKGGTAVFNDGNLIKAITANLPFWGQPSVLAGGPQTTNPTFNPSLVQSFTKSINRASGVSTILFGTPFNALDSTSAVAQLQRSTDSASANLQKALTLIMSNITTFLEFASNGTWCGSQNTLYNHQADGSTTALNTAVTTYQISETLSQNRFHATPMAIFPTKASFQSSDRTCTALGDVCKDRSSSGGGGKAYYWSNVTGMQYQATHEIGGDAYALLEYVETSTSAYMPVLFDGAYNCTLEGRAGGSVVDINADGSLDVSCLSALPMYLPKGTACPEGSVLVGGKCPFGYS